MAGQNITKKEVTLYYADWCGHCKTFKPEWFGFKGAYQQLKDEIEKKYLQRDALRKTKIQE